jgi:UDP-glucose 4-epimerase
VKIMITGGTGFIGSYIVQELVDAGHSVTILARTPTKVAGFLGHDQIDFVTGTLTDRDAIRRSLVSADACIHVALGWGDTAPEMAAADTLPSLTIFDEAVRAGATRIIYTSSIAVFGDARPAINDHTMPRPRDYYGATKAAAEAYLLALGESTGVQVNVVRPGYTFGGPVTEGASIYTDVKLPGLVRAAKRGEPIRVAKDDGTQFIWAGDLARVYSAVLGSAHTRRLYTAVSTNFTAWADIARLAVEQCGSASVISEDEAGLDPADNRNDVSAIADDFGLRFDSTDRLREHVAWIADRAD